MNLVLLWTDMLVFLLVLAIISFVLVARRREHMRAPWRQVARSRMGMAAAVILVVYVAIGLLDSIHFHPRDHDASADQPRYSADVISVFDWIMDPVRSKVEKTYSAPFATHLYAKETVRLPDGTQDRIYPRLEHGGAHLSDPETQRLTDIATRAGMGLIYALVIWLLAVAVLVGWQSRGLQQPFRRRLADIFKRRTPVPWDVIIYTGAVVIVFISLATQLAPHYHIFGTDKVGADVFYQTLKSIRTGLMIGTLTTLIMLPFALFLGLAAGYFRGWVDDVVQYTYTTLVSIPGVLLIAAAILLLQVYMSNNPEQFSTPENRADLRLLFLCLILGITSWTSLCRLLRGETLKLRDIEYVQAAQAFGVSHMTILTRHILPNVMHIVLITVVLDFSALVLAEAVLSYINIGVDPSMNSWGNMINSARLEMARDPVVWWSLAAAFIFMLGLVLPANLFSDAVRDAFDPRMRKLQNN
ncbi:peptide/nickel transport system permease protein [Methylohalomonas lacus]|uniref:Peptide/nickel transport system permease protein n=1 Tax=Methylohalomonas lacus TaxID=398773 RepID=A0AAE3HKQ0_9GAMM|nr:ABC transporter permease [Methylohalomonas lacus]MCS3903003.1 peptide/nickel transport system permease protein [Methylohalomonas lacus]